MRVYRSILLGCIVSSYSAHSQTLPQYLLGTLQKDSSFGCSDAQTYLQNKLIKTTTARLQNYNPMIQAYCNIVWGNSSEANELKVMNLQKRACGAVLITMYETRNSLKILSIYDQVYLRKAKFMLKYTFLKLHVA